MFSHILGAIFFAERLSLFGAVGTVLIAAGMLAVTARQPGGGEGAGACAKAAAGDSPPAAGGQQGRSGSFVQRLASFQRLLAAARGSGGDELEVAAATDACGKRGGASSEEGEGLLCAGSAGVERCLHSPAGAGVQLLEVRSTTSDEQQQQPAEQQQQPEAM